MRVALISTLVVAAAASARASTAADRVVIVGGFSGKPVAKEERQMLFKSLANETTYAEGVTARLCVGEIAKVEQQVVAGTNYRFTTSACDVPKTLLLQTNTTPQPTAVSKQLGECTKSFAHKCVEVDAVITVYEGFDGSTSVSSIAVTPKPVASEPAVAKVHAAMQKSVLRS
jgi:hypothetical protein